MRTFLRELKNEEFKLSQTTETEITCPHCKMTLVKYQAHRDDLHIKADLFPDNSELLTGTLYKDEDPIVLPGYFGIRIRDRVDGRILHGQCPDCKGHYYSLRFCVASRPVRNVAVKFQADENIESPFKQLFSTSDTPLWTMRRHVGVQLERDTDTSLLIVDEYQLGTFAAQAFTDEEYRVWRTSMPIHLLAGAFLIPILGQVFAFAETASKEWVAFEPMEVEPMSAPTVS